MPERRTNMPLGAVLAVAAPFVLLGAVAMVLAMRWDTLPLRYPTHWDINGEPYAWADRTWRSVFGPLIIGGGILLTLVITILTLQIGSKRQPVLRKSASLVLTIVVEWVLGVVLAIAALTPLRAQADQLPVPTWTLVLLPVFPVAFVIWWSLRAGSEPDEEAAEPTPAECWRWGQFYYNPEDPALFVEKRFGFGYTFNFAHRASWFILGAIIAIPLILIAIVGT